MDYSDSRWKKLTGGYRTPYNPVETLKKLESGFPEKDVWDEFWTELHHQGDVGDASYATIPELARIFLSKLPPNWQLFSFVSAIEIERKRKSNPPMPKWLATDYKMAIDSLTRMALDYLNSEENDPLATRTALGMVALGKGDFKLGAYLSMADQSEIDEQLQNYMVLDNYDLKRE